MLPPHASAGPGWLAGSSTPVALIQSGGRERLSVLCRADVAASLPPEQAPSAVVMIDPWYPAIPQDSAARTAWLSGCPVLTLGSHAFNKAKDDGNLVCDGAEGGLQQAVLRSAARGAAGRSSAQHSSILLVPTNSPHSMVDDLGAVMMDKCALPEAVLHCLGTHVLPTFPCCLSEGTSAANVRRRTRRVCPRKWAPR